ncbi:MAG: glycoside hydrolase family 9 protein [Cyclobacteriaceae bacterium]
MIIRILILFLPLSLCAQTFTDRIRLNQIGFYETGPKVAVVTGRTNTVDFFITSTSLRDTIFRGKLGAQVHSLRSDTDGRKADFSELKKTGSFVLTVPGLGTSHVFRIGKNILSDVSAASLKAFFFQRASVPLDETFAGKWHRSAGHPDNRVVVHPSAASAGRPAGFVIPSPGGWYDAGDYNKYIVNSGITMGTLLSAYEDFPGYYDKLNLNIPESGNGLADILDEVLYNLRWMLTMQDPADGGVYHKCTNALFDGMVMPGATGETRYVVQKSTAAALDFTAVMAQAARVLKPFSKQLPGLSDSCSRAAIKSWAWSLKNPDVVYDQEKMNKSFKPEIMTGAYGDGQFDDERFWASAELFSTTRDPIYLNVLNTMDQIQFEVPSWDKVAMLGVYTFLRSSTYIPASHQASIDKMKEIILSLADRYVSYSQQSAFGVPMGMEKKDFVWGSNSNAANQGILLMYAFRYTGERKYMEAALSNADYLLGRNATGYCFVTGFGSRSPMHPHHRQSIADGVTEPVPGFLAGGPNPFRQDQCTYAFVETETAYTDDDCSYASNEIAINWNAPAAYLFGALEYQVMKKN